MLAGRAAEWKRQWNEEGRQEGAAGVLLRLLERRFGPLPDTARARIASADVSSLENWGLRLLEAGSLDDVLR